MFKMLSDTHESNFVRQILQNLLLNLLSVNKCWQSFTISASVFFKNLLKCQELTPNDALKLSRCILCYQVSLGRELLAKI